MVKGITESVIEEIKARIDLADLISSYGVQLKRAGGSVKACCPFHHEKTPSFNINTSKGFYHCFGCGESGDAIKFVQKQEGLSFTEAVTKLAEQCGIKIEKKEDPDAGKRKRLLALMSELAAFYHRCLLKAKEAELAREYLKKRALDGEVAEDWTIGYAPSGVANILKWAEKYKYTPEELEAAGVIKAPTRPGDQGYHRFGGRLMFSIRDKQGRVVAFSGRQLVASKNSGKYVNSPETLIFKKKNVLFAFDKAAANIAKAPHREVLVCEGQIDCIRLHLSGFNTAVASQGTAFTEEHMKMLKRVSDQALLVFDDDAAGHKATIRSAAMLLAAEMPVRTVSLPGGDDPDSFLRNHPAEDFQKLLDGAESIVSFQCRVERAKEENPNSIDAVARISKAVLGTIAHCKSAVLKAQMVGEASKILGLPVSALNEELGKIKVEKLDLKSEDEGEDFDAEVSEPSTPEAPIRGASAAEVAPPPDGEFALMEFLFAKERNKLLDGMIGEFLPREVFAHDFTRRFVDTWRAEIAAGETDAFATFAASLDSLPRSWFDRVVDGASRVGASTMKDTDIMQNFVRSLWVDHLKRIRGTLAASGDTEADMRRLKISMDLKRFQQARWNTVKDLVRDYMKGEA